MDLVSGAYGRTPGLVVLDREVVQAARTGQALLVAHLRVDGSPDPDDVLRAPAPSVRSVTREDDLLIR
jgi:hypothetical protein